MRRITISADELKKIAIADIRTRRGCEGLGDIDIVPVTFAGAKSNWALRVTDIGTGNRDLIQLTAITVQRLLEKRYILSESEINVPS